MTFQQSCFNFGSKPFKYPPKDVQFSVMNDHGLLDEKKKAILPKYVRKYGNLYMSYNYLIY